MPEDHLCNICTSHAPGAAPWSTQFGHALSVPLPPEQCHCHTLPTATCRARSQPQLREICHLPRIIVVSVQIQPMAGIWQDMLEVSHSQRRNRKTALPTTTQKLQAAQVKGLKGGTQRSWGQAPRETDPDCRKQAAERNSSQQCHSAHRCT